MLTMNHTYRADGMMSDMNHGRTELVRQQAVDWQRQIVGLNAKNADPGLVVTLGSVLFENGKPELKRGAASTLGKLVAFLNKYQGCTAVIEGYTDNMGSETFNFGLSMYRANSIKSYLVSQGVASSRLATAGNGESSPIAGNDCASGRLLNQRVEVIISNLPSSAK